MVNGIVCFPTSAAAALQNTVRVTDFSPMVLSSGPLSGLTINFGWLPLGTLTFQAGDIDTISAPFGKVGTRSEPW